MGNSRCGARFWTCFPWPVTFPCGLNYSMTKSSPFVPLTRKPSGPLTKLMPLSSIPRGNSPWTTKASSASAGLFAMLSRICLRKMLCIKMSAADSCRGGSSLIYRCFWKKPIPSSTTSPIRPPSLSITMKALSRRFTMKLRTAIVCAKGIWSARPCHRKLCICRLGNLQKSNGFIPGFY